MYKVTEEDINKFDNAIKLKSPATNETYFIILSRLLDHTGGEISRDNILSFLGTYSKNSVLTAFYAIKFFLKAIELSVDIKRSDISPSGVVKRREILTNDEIQALISHNKEFGVIDIGYIALSTIYGMRRSEIYETENNHIDISNKRLIVVVKKIRGGEDVTRIHLIPDEILNYLDKMKSALKRIKRKPPITSLNHFLDYALEKSGVVLRKGLGFHSIRRALITELITADVNPLTVRNFIGWKPKERDILLDYVQMDPIKIDATVFGSHPYLKLWKE